MKYDVWSMNPATRAKQKAPYVVEAHDSGKWWSCTCPHWTIRLSKVRTRCKHIDFVIAHNKEQEKLQAEVAKSFENGYGFDLATPDEVKLDEDDDVSMAPAS